MRPTYVVTGVSAYHGLLGMLGSVPDPHCKYRSSGQQPQCAGAGESSSFLELFTLGQGIRNLVETPAFHSNTEVSPLTFLLTSSVTLQRAESGRLPRGLQILWEQDFCGCRKGLQLQTHVFNSIL